MMLNFLATRGVSPRGTQREPGGSEWTPVDEEGIRKGLGERHGRVRVSDRNDIVARSQLT